MGTCSCDALSHWLYLAGWAGATAPVALCHWLGAALGSLASAHRWVDPEGQQSERGFQRSGGVFPESLNGLKEAEGGGYKSLPGAYYLHAASSKCSLAFKII